MHEQSVRLPLSGGHVYVSRYHTDKILSLLFSTLFRSPRPQQPSTVDASDCPSRNGTFFRSFLPPLASYYAAILMILSCSFVRFVRPLVSYLAFLERHAWPVMGTARGRRLGRRRRYRRGHSTKRDYRRVTTKCWSWRMEDMVE